MTLVESVTNAICNHINLADAQLRVEHSYPCQPLCIIDAVFSMGVRYTTTQATVRRWAYANNVSLTASDSAASNELTISDSVRSLEGNSSSELAEHVFGNRQRTSSTNGILKAEAVRRFAGSLQAADINVRADTTNPAKVRQAETFVRQIEGQRSGISFSYFLILAGNVNEVKTDRMIMRFVTDAVGRAVSQAEAKASIQGASLVLEAAFPHVSTRLLDSEIWTYQSGIAANARKGSRTTKPKEPSQLRR